MGYKGLFYGYLMPSGSVVTVFLKHHSSMGGLSILCFLDDVNGTAYVVEHWAFF